MYMYAYIYIYIKSIDAQGDGISFPARQPGDSQDVMVVMLGWFITFH